MTGFLGTGFELPNKLHLFNAFMAVTALPIGLVCLVFVAPVTFLFRQLSLWLRLPRNMYRRTVVITGASSGIGEHIAYEYAQKGANLVLVARRGEELEKVAHRCQLLGAFAETCTADISVEKECAQVVQYVVSLFGTIDVLVNNAGVAQSYFFEEAEKLDDMRSVMDVNVLGYIFMTFFALPYLRRRKGQIVVITSTASFLVQPKFSIYMASKAATTAFFDTLRTEPIGREITITMVYPGVIQSEMTAGRVYDEHGIRHLDMQRRDAQLGPIPMMKTRDIAKRIFDAAIHDEHNLVVPFWYTVGLYFRIFVPEFMQAAVRVMLLHVYPQAGVPALSKLQMDMPGARKMFYGTPVDSENKIQTRPGEAAIGKSSMSDAST